MSTAIEVTNAIETADLVEDFVKSLVKSGADPHQIVVGLHNAFVHGSLFMDAGYSLGDPGNSLNTTDGHLLANFYNKLDEVLYILQEMKEDE